jgi:divalent metal cation (Fe/Co/Zn/Cd) transporter
MPEQVITTPAHHRAAIVRRGEKLEYFTVAYNSLEGLIAAVAGILAGSIALVGFGFDSLIEVTSGAILLWRLRADVDEARRRQAELVSIRSVGVCFLVLALYVGYESVSLLMERRAPERSLVGIGMACASLAVMPLLARAKRTVARQMASPAMQADAKQTAFCTYLSAILLAGLVLNALFGWWWADPAAALVMAPLMIKEGVDALGGKACCAGENRR